jgi:hypothetical protein
MRAKLGCGGGKVPNPKLQVPKKCPNPKLQMGLNRNLEQQTTEVAGRFAKAMDANGCHRQ